MNRTENNPIPFESYELFIFSEILKILYLDNKKSDILKVTWSKYAKGINMDFILKFMTENDYAFALSWDDYRNCKTIFNYYDFFSITPKGILYVENFYNINNTINTITQNGKG